MLNEMIDSAIYAHSQWKVSLRKAIESGDLSLDVRNVSNPCLCRFGQWLESPMARGLPHRNKILVVHQAFHTEAGRVVGLALSGDKEAALAGMGSGSLFMQLTVELVNLLGSVKNQ